MNTLKRNLTVILVSLMGTVAAASDLRTVVDQLRTDPHTPAVVVKAIEAGQPTPVRDYLGEVTGTQTTATTNVVNREIVLVDREQKLTVLLARYSLSVTNLPLAIDAALAAAVGAGATQEEQLTVQVDGLTMNLLHDYVTTHGGDFSGAATATNVTTAVLPTRYRWQDLGLDRAPNNNDLERR